MVSVWKQTVFGSRQKIAKLGDWEEEEEDREDRVLSCGQRALQAHWPGCVLLLLLHFDLLQETIMVISLERAAGFILLPFPSHNHDVFRVPALPVRRLCLACRDPSHGAGTVCCSVCTALMLLRPSGTAVVRVIMDSRQERQFWLDLPESQQLPALV